MGNSVPGRQLDGMKNPGHKLVSSGKGLHLSGLVCSLVPKAGWTFAERGTENLIAATTAPYQSTAGAGPRRVGRGLNGRSGQGGEGQAHRSTSSALPWPARCSAVRPALPLRTALDSAVMSTAMNFGTKSFQPRPPDKGSFPLDHFGEARRGEAQATGGPRLVGRVRGTQSRWQRLEC